MLRALSEAPPPQSGAKFSTIKLRVWAAAAASGVIVFLSARRKKKTVSYSNNEATGGGLTHECNNNKCYLAGPTIKLFLFFFFFNPLCYFYMKQLHPWKVSRCPPSLGAAERGPTGGEQRFCIKLPAQNVREEWSPVVPRVDICLP